MGSPSQPLGIGLLGTSRIARDRHLPALARARGLRLTAVGSRDAARARAWAAEFGAQYSHGDYAALIADPAVDAVLLTLPPALHLPWTLAAARAGKAVLCEKPLALAAGEVRALQAAAKEHNVIILEAMSPRFNPALDEVRRRIRQGEVGQPRILRAELTFLNSDWTLDSRTDPTLGKGVTYEAGCYCVHALQHLLEAEPVAVTAQAARRDAVGVVTSMVGTMRFPDGPLAVMHASMEGPFRSMIEVIGDDGRLEIPNLFAGDRLWVESAMNQERQEVLLPPTDRFVGQMEHFAAAVAGQVPPLIPLATTLAVTRTLDRLDAAFVAAATDSF